MKSFVKFSTLVLFLLVGLSFSSCDNNKEVKHEGKEYSSKYVCPMHCEGSGDIQPGTCPKCGMDYVENQDFKSGNSDNHDH